MLGFDEKTHTYTYNDQKLISVTQALGAAGLIDDQWYTERSRQIGTGVSRLTEYYDDADLDEKKVYAIYAPYLSAYKKFRKQCRIKILSVEERVMSLKYLYAGTSDRRCILSGHETIIDIKTGQKEKWHELQTAAYAGAFERPLRRFSLYLSPKAEYRLVEHKGETDFDVFLGALAVARWKTA